MPGDVVGEACATSTTTATSLADARGRAPDLAKPIMPETGCQFLTKVRHSAFYTALAYLLRQLVERLIPTRPDHRAGTVQRPGCLRAALLVHRGCPTRRPYRCHARRRRAEDDAQKHAGRIDSGRLGSALTLRLETWKLPSSSRYRPVPTIAARTCREHPDDDPPVQVGSCVRAAVLPRAATARCA